MSDFDSIFAEESEEDLQVASRPPWKVLIADDEPQVFRATTLALDGMSYDGRPIEFFSAGSGKEAIQRLEEHPDTAVIFLDIVMDTEDDGFQVVDHVRNKLANTLVRIVIRTGQPGQVNESQAMLDYEISDYKEKTELTSRKLATTLISALRNYRELMDLQGNVERFQSTVEGALQMTERLSDSIGQSSEEGAPGSVLLSADEFSLLRSTLDDLRAELKESLGSDA